MFIMMYMQKNRDIVYVHVLTNNSMHRLNTDLAFACGILGLGFISLIYLIIMQSFQVYNNVLQSAI